MLQLMRRRAAACRRPTAGRILVLLPIAAALAGCRLFAPASPPPSKPRSAAAGPSDPTVDPAPVLPAWLRPAQAPDSDSLPNSQDTARGAAMTAAALPPVVDPATRRELLLWQTLFAAAYDSNVGDFTRHFLLTPPESLPRTLSISEREFRLRVLAFAAEWDVPVAWGQPTGNSTNPGIEHFPGTREIATRLTVRLLDRGETGSPVHAEVSDATAHVGGSRQRMTLTWDDDQWMLDRDPARQVW